MIHRSDKITMNTATIFAIAVVGLILFLFITPIHNPLHRTEGAMLGRDLTGGVIGAYSASQLARGVQTSIKERRGDQAYFTEVAKRQKSKNSLFDQTITQAQLLGET